MAEGATYDPGLRHPLQNGRGPGSRPHRHDWAPTGVRVCVIGAGYVGLTASACLAHLGHDVVCADVSEDRVDRLRRGQVPILEEELPELLVEGQRLGRLHFTTSNTEAVTGADFVFLCLPTPQGDGGAADLSRVCEVAEEIGAHLRPHSIVIDKSTVPAGTSRLVSEALMRDDVCVVANPEFLAEGSAVRDFLEPDRIVIGSDDVGAAAQVATLYGRIAAPVVITDATSAELVKYASNAYLALRLSFVNSMAALCEAADADVTAVMAGMGSDHRIGRAFLKPGPGWGGSCFPKDTAALVHTAASRGFDFGLLRAAIAANNSHRDWVVEKITDAAGRQLEGVPIAVWGLTFKAGTDDLRDSAALAITRTLVARGAVVRAYDPAVTGPVEGVTVCASAEEACRGAAVLFIGTEWPEFAVQDLDLVGAVMADRIVVDARNLLNEDAARAAGFQHHSVGRRVTTVDKTAVRSRPPLPA